MDGNLTTPETIPEKTRDGWRGVKLVVDAQRRRVLIVADIGTKPDMANARRDSCTLADVWDPETEDWVPGGEYSAFVWAALRDRVEAALKDKGVLPS